MPRVISVHEYVLKPGVDVDQFEHAILEARDRGLFELPGLVECVFVKGIRGTRKDQYAAIWIYASERAWIDLWGPVGQPRSKDDYPPTWKTWEDDVLAPFLDRNPDEIIFTSYMEIF